MKSIREFLQDNGPEGLRGQHLIMYGPGHTAEERTRPYLIRVAMENGDESYYARDLATGATVNFALDYVQNERVYVLDEREVKPISELVCYAGFDYVQRMIKEARQAEGVHR